MSAASSAGRIGVWGASGSGKSSYVKKAIKGRGRVVVFDPLAEYGPLCRVTVRTADDVRKAMASQWRSFRIAYVPPAGMEARALSQLCKLLMRAQQTYKDTGRGMGLTLVVEELNLSFPVSGGAARCPGFAEVCSRGRHYGIEVYGLSQRIAEVDTRFRGNCTETVVLRQQGPRDLRAATDVLGISTDGNAVRNLRNLQYLHERNGKVSKGEVRF